MYIDWKKQWQQYSPNFKNGYVVLEFENKKIYLKPGPGFGDYSHPTTQLTLELMRQQVSGKHVIDIGCGSGILSISAIALGAHCVNAIDIDPEALEHTKVNVLLNDMKNQIFLYFPSEFEFPKNDVVICMNMISSEQKKIMRKLKGKIITSGILQEEIYEYLEYTSNLGWKLEEIKEKNGWLGFRFFF